MALGIRRFEDAEDRLVGTNQITDHVTRFSSERAVNLMFTVRHEQLRELLSRGKRALNDDFIERDAKDHLHLTHQFEPRVPQVRRQLGAGCISNSRAEVDEQWALGERAESHSLTIMTQRFDILHLLLRPQRLFRPFNLGLVGRGRR